MAHNTFIDPGTGETYVWEVNHDTVAAAARTRFIEHQHPTANGWVNTMPVRLQGATTAELHRLSGTALSRSQHEAFLHFWAICAERSIHFLPCTGGRYEVVVRSYEPTRKRVVSGPRGTSLQVWKYTLDMEIVTQIS